MRHVIDSMTLEICRLMVELDQLFVGTLDGWIPTTRFELENIKPKKIRMRTKKARIKIFPEHWPAESEIYCGLLKIGTTWCTWSVHEVTLKAPHVHNTEIGGIDITLPVIGGQILIPKETESYSSEVVTNIILKKKAQTGLCC